MADNEEGATRGNEWEVVSLTASAYSASPGPKVVEGSNYDEGYDQGEDGESSRALFMSGHFVFPPSQHENLPLESDAIELHSDDAGKDNGGKDVVSEYSLDDGGRSSGKDENWPLEGLSVADDFPGLQLFDKSTTLQGLGLVDVDKEQSIYSTSKLRPFHNDGSTTYPENPNNPDIVEPSSRALNLSAEASLPSKRTEEDKYDVSDHPLKAWWKRRATSMYVHAKDANAVWSVFIAAAVTGLVILGHHWQQERWQILQQKWLFSINDEKKGGMLGPISRLKDVIVSSNVRGSFARASSSAESRV